MTTEKRFHKEKQKDSNDYHLGLGMNSRPALQEELKVNSK